MLGDEHARAIEFRHDLDELGDGVARHTVDVRDDTLGCLARGEFVPGGTKHAAVARILDARLTVIVNLAGAPFRRASQPGVEFVQFARSEGRAHRNASRNGWKSAPIGEAAKAVASNVLCFRARAGYLFTE